MRLVIEIKDDKIQKMSIGHTEIRSDRPLELVTQFLPGLELRRSPAENDEVVTTPPERVCKKCGHLLSSFTVGNQTLVNVCVECAKDGVRHCKQCGCDIDVPIGTVGDAKYSGLCVECQKDSPVRPPTSPVAIRGAKQRPRKPRQFKPKPATDDSGTICRQVMVRQNVTYPQLADGTDIPRGSIDAIVTHKNRNLERRKMIAKFLKKSVTVLFSDDPNGADGGSATPGKKRGHKSSKKQTLAQRVVMQKGVTAEQIAEANGTRIGLIEEVLAGTEKSPTFREMVAEYLELPMDKLFLDK